MVLSSGALASRAASALSLAACRALAAAARSAALRSTLASCSLRCLSAPLAARSALPSLHCVRSSSSASVGSGFHVLLLGSVCDGPEGVKPLSVACAAL